LNRLDPTNNSTPAHELFHLYQYGYALFKQRWYLEGMAKWMETVFKPEEPVSIAMTAPVDCTRGIHKVITAQFFGKVLQIIIQQYRSLSAQ